MIKPYILRVIHELHYLVDKMERLEICLNEPVDSNYHEGASNELLKQQLEIMNEYIKILLKRLCLEYND